MLNVLNSTVNIYRNIVFKTKSDKSLSLVTVFLQWINSVKKN